jgi:signal transduction histidine kinase
MATRVNPTLRDVSDAVLAVTAELSVEEVLQRLVDAARELASARYAALGLPDGEGGFRQFLTSGMSDDLIALLGPLPRQHGVLGAMLETRAPYRTRDVREHPRFYLAEKIGAADFTDDDEELIGLLAAHAAIAIANARLYERSRELSVVAERNRLALDLHDAVSQKLFALVLGAETAATLLDRDPDAARAQVTKLQSLAQEAFDELRSLVFELRPPDLERDGLRGALRKHVELLRRAQQREIALDVDDRIPGDPVRDAEVLRIAQEALQNALRHSHAEHVAVGVHDANGRLVLEVADDGVGFRPDVPELRARRLGLTSMEERAQRIGGRLEIRSAPGEGTTIRLEVGGG